MFDEVRASIPTELQETIKLNCDIPRWYDELDVTRDGVTKKLSHWVIDKLDTVTIMDYRTSVPGIIAAAESHIIYGNSAGKKIVIALETGPEEVGVTFKH
jgi:hypothetical protein